MTKEEAIKRIKACFDKLALDDKDIEAIQILIPELHGSEDEKFQKYILRVCKECVEANDKGLELSMSTTKKLLSYLEKQKAKERLDRMAPIYNDKESFESALEKAWKYYNESASRTVDSFEDDYIECVFSKGFREGFLYKEKQKEEEGYEAIPVESTLEYKLGFKAGKESENPNQERIDWIYDRVNEEQSNRPKLSDNSLGEEIAGMYQALFGTDVINRKEMLYLDTFEAIARHFAQWGAEHVKEDGNVILAEEDFNAEKEKSMKWGYNLCKEQMMKDAVGGEIISLIPGRNYVKVERESIAKATSVFKEGDKVRIIIVKEDNQ